MTEAPAKSPQQEFIDGLTMRLAQCFNIKTDVNIERFKHSLEKEDNITILQTFFSEGSECKVFFVVQTSVDQTDLYTSELPPIDKLKKKVLVVMKGNDQEIVKEELSNNVLIFELTRNIIDHMYLTLDGVMVSVMQNPENQQGWTDLITKDLIEKMVYFVSQTYVLQGLIQGKTLLPLPSEKQMGNSSLPEKDRARIYESQVMTWTKQIKHVLRQEPEDLLKKLDHPGPLVELEFWRNKADNLNQIHDQLNLPAVKTIMSFLEKHKSTYTKPFAKLTNEVHQARIEANDNKVFLKLLEDLFVRLSDTGNEFILVWELFLPIMHGILAIWQQSHFYNTMPRLIVLIREICNAVILRAQNYIDGPTIFGSITAKEGQEAVDKLQNVIDVCTKLKDAYFEYKVKADQTWKISSNTLFVRLDQFLERIHDIQNICKTAVQYAKLEKAELGGTKGRVLTEAIMQITTELDETIEEFTQVKYDIMDISDKEFEEDFQKFRERILDLEKRLSSVVSQSFDDCNCLHARFKIFEIFDPLLDRPIIQDELESKYVVLIDSYRSDLKEVQKIFLDGKKLIEAKDERAPIYMNMAPISGAMKFCQALTQRIQEPYEKLNRLGPTMTEREEYKDVEKLYFAILKLINDYQLTKRLNWESDVEANSQDKLKQTLLVKFEDNKLQVNFDESLIRLLREVKYLHQLQQPVSEVAAEVYSRDETFRQQIVGLSLIVENYNYIVSSLHPVEEPLVRQRIQEMEAEMVPGIVDLRWSSENIDEFIAKSKVIVDSLYEVVMKMKQSQIKIAANLESFNVKMLERKNKPMLPEDYDQYLKALTTNKLALVKENGASIHKQIKEVLDAVKARKDSPQWKTYSEYINCIVIEGIATAIRTSLLHLNNQIDPEYILKNDLQPMFDIRLELNECIVYEPDICEINGQSPTVRNVIRNWMNDFFFIAGNVNRLDSIVPGDFLQEIRSFFEIRDCLSLIGKNLDFIEQECDTFKAQFNTYSYLWEHDPVTSFNTFLDENLPEEAVKEEDPEALPAKDNPLLKDCRKYIPDLDLFDDRIASLKAIQQEISRIVTPKVIYWLKIDLQPMKVALEKRVIQWTRVYTDFLVNEFKTLLRNLVNFIETTNEGIQKNPAAQQNEGDNALLMKVMRVISDVKDVEASEEEIIVRMRNMVLKLKKHNVQIAEKGGEDPLQSIDNAHVAFIETSGKVFKVKADILPLQNQETVNIKRNLETFMKQVSAFREEFLATLPYTYDDKMTFDDIDSFYDIIQTYHRKLEGVKDEAQGWNDLEKLFEIQRSEYKQLTECENDLKSLKLLWDAIAMVNYQYNDWKTQPWRQIKDDLLMETNKILASQLKTLPKEIKNMKAYAVIVDRVKNMGTVLPLVNQLHSPFLEDRHWAQLKETTQKVFDHKSLTFTFEEILGLNLYKYEAFVNEIVDVASKEAKIEKKLKQIENAWNRQIFEFTEYKETKIFLPFDDLIELLDQHQLDLMGMKSQGKYVEYFFDTVELWRERLGKVDSVANIWLKVQKNWRILVNIFIGSEDIRMQLPEDTKIFEQVDKDFRDMMSEVSTNPNVIEACTHERQEVLETMMMNIKKCEKALNDYLEQKKKAFPRFYFLSNQSLLTILSNGQNPPKVCEYLGDCFDGLKTLEFVKNETQGEFDRKAIAMYSKDNEKIEFQEPFMCEGIVEGWLLALELKMRETLYHCLETAKASSELWDTGDKPREEWVEGICAQIALLTTQIVWTEDVTRAFEDLSGGSENAMKECQKLVETRLEQLIKKVRGDLTLLERWKVINIITIDVHGRDVVERLVAMKIQEAESFQWLAQLKFYWENRQDSDMHTRQNLRFYWEQDKSMSKCIIRIVDWFRYYSYEYVGNALRLVVTPLTDRCYITLTQALNLTMGGAPAGPAGTGKTETTKDLGRGVGIMVVVFNCSDQMNKDSMAQIFMGLAQSGNWGCFDEFNRIAIEVLSVISSQVKCILDAMKEKKSVFNFMEEGDINLKDSVGFFITMNPGYAGRTELPDNLKALFRSCAMVVPDLVLICENMLMSEGFTLARPLSRKFVSLYMLSRELLSKARHYDWGLRAVKSVLRQAGALKRTDPNIPEDPLLMRALRDFNMPKIVTDDKPIFLRLIGDLFPKLDCPQRTDPDFRKLVHDTAKKDMGLIPEELFIIKVIQLYEILEVRHCCFVIGPPGCGKTMVWKTLAKAQTNRKQDTEYDTLNPKGVTADELFGAYTKTKEWKNGVLAVIMKNQVKNDDKYKAHHWAKWTILDGDVDPEWIESLNTVMDDNKVLTLVSNDRIPLSPQMRLLFEVSNLRNATPATVSRAGVLFINETDIGWIPYMNQWLERSIEKVARRTKEGAHLKETPPINEIGKSVFYRCFQQYFEQNPDVHDKLRVRHIVPMVDIAIVTTICTILDAMLIENADKLNAMKEDDQKLAYEAFFIFAGLWAIGGPIGGGQDDEKDMRDFNGIWKNAAKIKFPEQNMSYDYFYDLDAMKWAHWSQKVKPYIPSDETIYSKIYVPTIHTTRLRYLLSIHLHARKPILLVGGAGTGKTAVVKDYLATTKPEKVSYSTINFSSFTDSLALQRNIEGMVEKKSGKTYGSATNKTLICYIDDLNMPYVDKYGTQSPIQLLRQILDYGSIFNRDQLEERKFLQDLLFFACLNQKSGSFNVDLRLQRNFSVFTMFRPSADIIKAIFGVILNAHLATIDAKFQKLADPLVDLAIFVFTKILKDTSFSPSSKKFHYQFNFREIAKVVEGLCRSTSHGYKVPYDFQRLAVHEITRVFGDRLINETDQATFQKYLKDGYTSIFEEPKANENPFETELLYSSFVSTHLGLDTGYDKCEIDVLKTVLLEKLEEYNDTKAQMNLVLFNQAMGHVQRIARLIDLPQGNVLLVGVGGSGKQSLAKLASFIVGFELDQLIITANFGFHDLKSMLQDIFKKIARPNAMPRVFMVTDSQIKDDTFLIPINDMLSQSWVLDLFPKDEIDGMVSAIRNEAKGAGVVDQGDAVQQYFFDKMKRNLKVVLCFSPVGDTMRIRARKFPGIINNTSIDWFHPWPKDALIDVAARFIDDIEFPSDEIKQAISLNMAEVHMSINDANQKYLRLERRYNYTTPKSFLELIDFYRKLLGDKRENIDRQIEKYQAGLQILAETQGKVQGLQEDLTVVMVEVEKQREATNILIDKVSTENAHAEAEQAIANQEEEATNIASKNAEELKAVADVALAEAIPALNAARNAVDCIQKSHITEMKNLGSPPAGVITAARVVLILTGEKITLNDPDDKVWKKSVITMNNPQSYIDKIKNFSGENIEQSILDQVNKIISDPAKKFTFDAMKQQNFAASYLCLWSIKMVEFNHIYKKVKPLDDAQKHATETMETKKRELAAVKERVQLLNDKVNALKGQLGQAEAQKAEVEAEANACQAKLTAAEKLVTGLASENKRWGENVVALKAEVITIIGDALLASSFVSYIGAFSAPLRIQLWKDTWLPDIEKRAIPFTEGVRPLKILTTEVTKAKWMNEGLPADHMSLENAAIISSCQRWPLIIDPQLQGQNWIKGRQGDNLIVISISAPRWLATLSTAIQMGKAVMLEGIQEEIDATLDPLLQRAIIKRGKGYQLELAGQQLDYDLGFQLFLITKRTNPHFKPEIAAQCTIINFIVTEKGLEDQLLALVVNIEKNELEQHKQELVKQQNEFSVTLGTLENNLLEALASADPDTILENKELIENLDKTKQTTLKIQEQQQSAQITEKEINTQRENYRPVATEGAMLYFLAISLCVIDHMYQYSLEAFTSFFFKAINQTTEKGEERIQALIRKIRYIIYQWISRGLFEKHKIIFLTLITFRLMQKNLLDVQYDPAEMDFLIKAPSKPGVENNLDWLPPASWDLVQSLIQLDEFHSFAQNLEKDAPTRFKDWYNELTPEEVKLPLDWKKLDTMPFKKLLVLRCLRPDRVGVALTNYIRATLPDGELFVDMDSKLAFSDILTASIGDAEPNNPIFFILSPGADPVKEVEKAARKKGIEPGKSFWNISLGQGQDEIARRRIEEGSKEGHWVMLQNIHLMPTWLVELEKILDSFGGDTGSGNANFRLFLSAEPSKGVPIGILDRSIKLTNEPPTGLKANMKRAWTYFNRDEIEDKDPKIKSILFALCYFHSTVIERKRFGPMGWNMVYPFNVGDLRDSYLVMNRYMEQNAGGKVPFDDLIYIFGEIMYGGHIVDDWDRKLCSSYLLNIMHEGLFDELELFPFIDSSKGLSFKVPGQNPYEKYIEHMEQSLTQETPLAYGLHPNAEIGFKTAQCMMIFNTLIELQPKDSGTEEKSREVKSPQEITIDLIKYLCDDVNIRGMIFNLDEIKNKIDAESKGPYQNVFLQEIEYMNNLLLEMCVSLEELDQGFKGILTISEQMERTIESVGLNRVPVTWMNLAYPSKRGLSSWLQNLFQRIEQLNAFRDDPYNLPKVIMISRFFNPQSFLTAIMQVIGRQKQAELNKLYIQTEITKRTIEEIDSVAKEGAYVFGFVLQGARWDIGLNCLEDSRPKEMFSVLPVVYCKAQPVPAEGKEDRALYLCPAYKTEDRGSTYVFTAQLRTRQAPRKWILAGVAIIMDVEGVSDVVAKAEKK